MRWVTLTYLTLTVLEMIKEQDVVHFSGRPPNITLIPSNTDA